MKQNIYTKTQVDHSTGEVKESTFLTKKMVNTEQFIRTYVEDIGMLAKCSGAETSVVLCALKYLDYNTNEIVLNSDRRASIAECGNLKLNTVNTAISRLYKKNIFVKENKKTILNPKLFFYGTDLERYSKFKLSINYEICPDC